MHGGTIIVLPLFFLTVSALRLLGIFKKDDRLRPVREGARAGFSLLVVPPVSSRGNEKGFLAATAVRLFQTFL